MKRICLASLAVVGLVGVTEARAEAPALTIYNQDFAVVRDILQLELKAGMNEVRCTDITAHLESDSVILRDPAGKHPLRILEQNYCADPLSQELLLSMYEGKTIEFMVVREGQPPKAVQGKIVRSPYVLHQAGLRRYGGEYYMGQTGRAYPPYGTANQPIIEVDGKLQFNLPGTPVFPALGDEAVLKPSLQWKLETPSAGKVKAELSYITGGMSWEADYNIVSPKEGSNLDVIGWVTMDNQSGKGFENARIKLMAGDVNKLSDEEMRRRGLISGFESARSGPAAPVISQQAFDEYHLYTLERPTSLHDRETKQVEFIRATGIKANRLYVYDGAKLDPDWTRRNGPDAIRSDRNFGVECNQRVWAMSELVNSEANHLGVPLPKGRMRFYRRGDDGQLEFVGENTIDHTPKNETIRVYLGGAFDLAGERVQTDFSMDNRRQWVDETFEIKLRNHKAEPVEIRVLEHMYRGRNWEIKDKTHPFDKKDSHTIEFRVEIPPDKEETIRYTVHYTWERAW